MIRILALLLLGIPLTFLSGCVVAPHHPHSRVDVGGTFVNGDLSSFYLSLGEYYRVPERDVIFIRERRIPDHEIPVILFISQRAGVSLSAIINLRLAGSRWMDISLHFGLGPELYYVPVQRVHGSPYGHAYGHFQNRNRNEWQKIRLADDDVVNLVNLRFISERYGYPAEDVMQMRSSGKSFLSIHDEARRYNKGSEYRQQERKYVREPVEQKVWQEREARQPERGDVREPVVQQNRQERAIRQDTHDPAVQQGSHERDARQPERRDVREPVVQQNRQERESRQQERKLVLEPVKQQDAPDKASRQQERKEARESAKQQDQRQKESSKNVRRDEEDSTK